MRRIGLAALAALVLGVAACDSPTVPRRTNGYEFAYDGFGPRIIYRWQDAARIGVYVVPSVDAERRAILAAAVEHATRVWNDVALFGEYEFVDAPLERADVVIAWANEPLPVNVSGCPPGVGGYAWTTFCLDSTVTPSQVAASQVPLRAIHGYALLEGQHASDGVHMLVHVLDDPNAAGMYPALLAHELGHVLGIGTHPCRPGSPACNARRDADDSLLYSGLPERATPSSADISTMQLLYHTRPHLIP